LSEQVAPGDTDTHAPAHPHQSVHGLARQPGSGAAYHFSTAVKRTAILALEHHGLGDVFSPLADEAQADSNVVTGAADRLHGAPDIALIDVREENLHTVAAGVAAQGVDGVETHRLIVE